MEYTVTERTVDGVVVERLTIDPESNEGTIEVFNGDDVSVFTRRLVDGSIEVRDEDDELVEPQMLSWVYIYGVDDAVPDEILDQLIEEEES